ncbi:hypothetical protein HNR19_000799 [Nocardioides thalensis]|uniref:YdhG-like domain-containing protein n=1 Tax=Nocardioides thalensis TaxID=1914755 RepID=A0A853BYS3_9ACTN|nr:DUF1801 domain-containing protein [Nocardioides thalensis]NYJ00101.1 hypothetical protein [Nocardioides thalensis]
MATTDIDIDEYVSTKVLEQHRDTVTRLRALMRKHAPEAREAIMYGSLAWRQDKVLAITSVSKAQVTFAFERGAQFEDAHGLLDGVGKKTRHVKLKTAGAINESALADYIAQAVRLDQGG